MKYRGDKKRGRKDKKKRRDKKKQGHKKKRGEEEVVIGTVH